MNNLNDIFNFFLAPLYLEINEMVLLAKIIIRKITKMKKEWAEIEEISEKNEKMKTAFEFFATRFIFFLFVISAYLKLFTVR